MVRMARRAGSIATLVSCALLCSGCAETNFFGQFGRKTVADQAPSSKTTTGSVYKIGKPYNVGNVWYYPQEDFSYDETGIGSWYGPYFHGKLTANGEQFDQNAVTAAHKTLPLPSIARVTNLDNGRSLVVRINDRGPFVNSRIIDLSRRSAQLLGMEDRGTARVRVQIMAEESRALISNMRRDGTVTEPTALAAPRETVSAETLTAPPGARNSPTRTVTTKPLPAISPSEQRREAATLAAEQEIGHVNQAPVHGTNIFVQAGAFSRYENALRLSARLIGIGSAQIQQASVKGQMLFRVRIGPMPSIDEADRVLEQVISMGQPDARLVVD